MMCSWMISSLCNGGIGVQINRDSNFETHIKTGRVQYFHSFHFATVQLDAVFVEEVRLGTVFTDESMCQVPNYDGYVGNMNILALNSNNDKLT